MLTARVVAGRRFGGAVPHTAVPDRLVRAASGVLGMNAMLDGDCRRMNWFGAGRERRSEMREGWRPLTRQSIIEQSGAFSAAGCATCMDVVDRAACANLQNIWRRRAKVRQAVRGKRSATAARATSHDGRSWRRSAARAAAQHRALGSARQCRVGTAHARTHARTRASIVRGCSVKL
ncbi:hypothetical protein FGB62_99g07 [Gracilaria domingensis]|nr:hypothetical protein FGB62_99g07 [Gracilaria domingensis]